MFPFRPFLAAIGAAIAVTVLMWFFGDAVPGEEMGQLFWQLMLFCIGLCLLPPMAFGWAARDTNIYSPGIVAGTMLVFQVALLALFLYSLMRFNISLYSLSVLVTVVVILPILSGLLALAVTGNLRRVMEEIRGNKGN